jgi:hypothetical protein
MLKVHSLCLPYFSQDMVSIFLLDGRKISIPPSQFQDVTSEGGRFHQLYTFLIGGDENVPKGKEKMVEGSWNSQNSF